MKLLQLLRHLFVSPAGTRRRFSPAVLAAIEATTREVEQRTSAEIQFIIETDLDLARVWRGLDARVRARQLFALQKVWDTELRYGVLIYVLDAERDVEIVADRGAAAKISAGEWEAACKTMEEHFRAGRFEAGAVAGIRAVGALLERHFPTHAHDRDELTNQPTLL
jgi:uncharacterized membrane protein